MKHVRTLGLCLLATLALGAMGVASASAALPEWGQCNAEPEGKYEDAGCTVKAHRSHGKSLGKYEWSDAKSSEDRFTLGVTHFETPGGKAITCEGGHGEIALGEAPDQSKSSKDVSDTFFTFTGCREGKNGEGAACNDWEEGGEEIGNYNDWYVEGEGYQGQIGLVTGGSDPTVGVYLAPFDGERLPMWEAACEGALGSIEIGDTAGSSVIGTISPLNEMVGTGYPNHFTVSFTGSAGVQVPKKLKREDRRGLMEESLFTTEPMSMSTTLSTSDSGEAPLEIKATR